MRDVLKLAVLEDAEIFLAQIRNGVSFCVANDHADGNQIDARLDESCVFISGFSEARGLASGAADGS